MNERTHRYIIICPVRNEEKYLERSIQSIVDQTILPLEYIIVDDGSTDRTPEIIRDACSKYPWVKSVRRQDRGERKVGPGVVETFNDGYRIITSQEYDFICKIDGDLTVGPRYFETLFAKFDQDPFLGAASGKLFLDLDDGKLVEERITDESVLGGVLCMRKKCFDIIGGFVRQVMWDGITFHRCRMEGFRTRSFRDKELMIYDHRIMGSSHKSILHGRTRWGWGQYFMGTHPLYILAIGAYRIFERPFFIGGFLILWGYIKAWIMKTPRYDFPGFRKSLHAWQMERLKLGKRLEVIPLP